jgi:hypothetical protein
MANGYDAANVDAILKDKMEHVDTTRLENAGVVT